MGNEDSTEEPWKACRTCAEHLQNSVTLSTRAEDVNLEKVHAIHVYGELLERATHAATSDRCPRCGDLLEHCRGCPWGGTRVKAFWTLH